jgi:uncharacterized membrane protein
LVISALIFLALLGIALGCGFEVPRSILLAFDIAAMAFLAMAAWMFSHSDKTSMKARAGSEDNGRWGFLFSSIAVSAVVLIALGAELQASGKGDVLEIVLAATSLVLSWLFMNTMFALHYAHGFYAEREQKRNGLMFPNTREPDYWDFAYFAMVLGMTFQVSDVQITDSHLRRLALMHSVIAFFFNVVIVALSVNLIAGKA